MFEVVFEGVPPDHVDGWQVDRAAAAWHQGFAFFAAANDAAVAALVAQHGLIGVAAQAVDVGGGQGGELRAGEAFDFERQAAGQGIADLGVIRFRAPAFAEVEAARRQPWCIDRVGQRFRFDRQRNRRRAHSHQFAGLGPRGVCRWRGIDQRGAERLRGDRQRAAVLRIDRVAHLDHAVAQAIDVFFVGARVAKLFDARIGDLQRAQAAVVVQRD